jgi:drug/metabolite transporter (DMT)-like permease
MLWPERLGALALRTHVIMLIVMSFSAACGYVLVKVLEDQFTPLTMAASRAFIGAILILSFCVIARQPIRPLLRDWWQMMLIGLVGVGMLWVMVSLGDRHVDADLTTVLICIVPIATLLISVLPPRPKPVWWPAWIGAAIATMGLTIAVGPAQIIDEPSALVAVLMIATGFAGFAFANVLVEIWTKVHSPVAVAGVTMFMASVMLWILAIALESPMSLHPSGKAWAQLVALGILGAAIPSVLMIMLVHRAGAVFASLYGYVLPVFGIILASIVFKSAPSRMLFIGAPIAFAGVALLQWSRSHKLRSDEGPSSASGSM